MKEKFLELKNRSVHSKVPPLKACKRPTGGTSSLSLKTNAYCLRAWKNVVSKCSMKERSCPDSEMQIQAMPCFHKTYFKKA